MKTTESFGNQLNGEIFGEFQKFEIRTWLKLYVVVGLIYQLLARD